MGRGSWKHRSAPGRDFAGIKTTQLKPARQVGVEAESRIKMKKENEKDKKKKGTKSFRWLKQKDPWEFNTSTSYIVSSRRDLSQKQQ